jgi:hypothetical protein
MTLDQRARQAVEGLTESVSGHPLLLMRPAGRAAVLPRVLSFAGAMAVVFVLGMAMMQVGLFASDEDPSVITEPPPTTATTTTTTVPDTTEPPVQGPEGAAPVPATVPVETTPQPDTTPPELVVTSPLDGDHVEEKTIRFEGTTEPGAVVMAGPYEAEVDDAGVWWIVLVLDEGGNRATFTATDPAGNTAEASIVIHYDAPTTTTTKPEEPKSTVEFIAHAVYGSCESDPPYDVYYGTADPGTKILVSSEYGSGSTVANGEGHWEVRVEFPDAPKGKTFLVKVKNETTYEKFTFEFTSWAP